MDIGIIRDFSINSSELSYLLDCFVSVVHDLQDKQGDNYFKGEVLLFHTIARIKFPSDSRNHVAFRFETSTVKSERVTNLYMVLLTSPRLCVSNWYYFSFSSLLLSGILISNLSAPFHLVCNSLHHSAAMDTPISKDKTEKSPSQNHKSAQKRLAKRRKQKPIRN